MAAKERNIQNTLVSLVYGIIGRETTIDMRNEDKIIGEIEDVDEYMSIDLRNVTYTNIYGHKSYFERFYIKGSNIRYVHIPPDVDIIKTIEWEIDNNKRRQAIKDLVSTSNKRSTTAKTKEKRRLKVDQHLAEMKKKLNLL